MNQPNQSQWENACKSRGKHIKWAVIGLICLVPVSLLIICNNRDQLDSETNQKKNVTSDSSIFDMQFTDSLAIEKLSNGDTAHIADLKKQIETSTDQKKKSSTDSADTAISNFAKHSVQEKPLSKASTVTEKKIISAISRKDTSETQMRDTVKSFVKKAEKSKLLTDNNPREYSIMLPEIHYYAVDRKDIIISLALELFYTDSVSGREILLMRDALNTIALNVFKNKELALLNKDSAARELEIKMNEIFERKTLSRVMVREFNIEKATKQ